MKELYKECRNRRYYPLLNFIQAANKEDVNKFDGFGELVYIDTAGKMYSAYRSDVISDIRDHTSSAYKEDPEHYLIGVLWYNK